MSTKNEAAQAMVSRGRAMFGIGTIGILGCVAFMMCNKFFIAPAFKEKRLAESCKFAETLMQLEAQQEQKKKEDFEN